MDQYVKPEHLWLKAHPELNERWVQNLIAQDPSVVGLGELDLRAQERMQPRAGRLDLLLQDPETKRRYEVEVQLGGTDEAHIIRTIEYWDIERKRYPQYDHCAVLIAEDITSRFLNVISLFNGAIPLVAIQMQALRVGGQLTLIFTRVVDELSRGLVDEDEEAEAAPADRSYWEQRATKGTVALADNLLAIARQIDPSLELKYNKFYIGISKDGLPFNFVSFRPKKAQIRLEIKLPQTDDITSRIEASGLDMLDYDSRWNQYKLRLTTSEITAKRDFIEELMRLAYERRSSS
jgi:hypothetical protein